MSKVAIQGNASGTGTFTIAAPNSNTDRTLTLPDEAGTVLTSASTVVYPKGVPIFAARLTSNQALSASTWTKMNMNTEQTDTAGYYDAANAKFQPSTSGWYLCSGNLDIAGTSTSTICLCAIYKNSSIVRVGTGVSSVNGEQYVTVSCLVYLNGSTDYVELFGFSSYAKTAYSTSTGQYSYFEGHLVRAD